jgi:hypothetical protein
MFFLPVLVERQLRAATGFDFKVSVLRANPFTGRLVVRGLTATNPPTYPSPTFVELRELTADVDEFSWFFSDRVMINELDVDTKTIELVRLHDGTSNAGAFMDALHRGGGAPGTQAAAPSHRHFFVKRLHIRLEKLVVADYTGSKSEVKVYTLNIDQSYTSVSDPRQLIVPQVVKMLHSFGLHHDVAGLLPGEFGQALAMAVGGVADVGSALRNAVRKTGESLKGALDKLEQSPKP